MSYRSPSQKADSAAAPTLSGSPAADDDFLGVPVLVLDPRRGASTRLVGGVTPFGDQALPAVCTGMFERLVAVAGQQVGNDEIACGA